MTTTTTTKIRAIIVALVAAFSLAFMAGPIASPADATTKKRQSAFQKQLQKYDCDTLEGIHDVYVAVAASSKQGAKGANASWNLAATVTGVMQKKGCVQN